MELNILVYSYLLVSQIILASNISVGHMFYSIYRLIINLHILTILLLPKDCPVFSPDLRSLPGKICLFEIFKTTQQVSNIANKESNYSLKVIHLVNTSNMDEGSILQGCAENVRFSQEEIFIKKLYALCINFRI